MKKILITIGAFGLVATTGNALIACSYNKNDQSFFQLNTYEIHLSMKSDVPNEKNHESETLEILDFLGKMEQFIQKANEWSNRHNYGEIKVTLELKHFSGITNLDCVWKQNESPNLISFKSLETKGKSTWVLNLYAEGTTRGPRYSVNSTYFDVNIE